MAKVIYWGIFFEEAVEGILSKTISNQHVTCGFRVAAPEGIEWGALTTLAVTGYGCNGRNEGLRVAKPEHYLSDATPHITISVADDAKPVDTKHVSFEPCSGEVVGRWGWYGSDGEVHFE